MRESFSYRRDLEAYAASFRARKERQVWRDDSLTKAEKMLFVGFLIVRKLIECQKVTDKCASSSVELLRGPVRRTREVSGFLRDDLFDDLNNIAWSDATIDVHQLCDKVIHTWWIIPVQDGDSGLGGFMFTTDRKKNSGFWLLPALSIVEVFERFANSAVRTVSKQRDGLGRLTYWRAE
jgi:hypothetical protein